MKDQKINNVDLNCGKCSSFNVDDGTSLFHINVQALSNKVDQVNLFLSDFNLDILCITEHWLNESCLKSINLYGYILSSYFCRSLSVHGGVCIFLKKDIKFKRLMVDEFCQEFHSEFCAIELPDIRTNVIVVYRSGVNGDFRCFLLRLELLLVRVAKKTYKTVLVGDFNVRFDCSSADLLQFLNLIDSFGLEITITDFTRVTRFSSSCIDNIITDIDRGDRRVGVYEPNIADHRGQYLILKGHLKNKTSYVSKRIINDASLSEFLYILSMTCWDDYFSLNDVNEMANWLIDLYNCSVKQCFKLKRCKTDRAPVRWFNRDLIDHRNFVSAARTICEVINDPSLWARFRNIKKNYENSIKYVKRTAYNDFINTSRNKSKDCWRLINYECNRKNRHSINVEINANRFNKYFSSVADTIIGNVGLLSHNSSYFLKFLPPMNCSFFLFPVTEYEVFSTINSLKRSSAVDAFELNDIMLKKSVELLVGPLTLLINSSFTQGIYPDIFKISKVVPLYKKGDTDVIGNYRPISIIVVFSKVFEILLKNRLYRYFEKNNLLHTMQFGFRSKKSTSKALLEIVGDIVGGLELGEHSTLTLCDLSKAFDCVSHELLIEKLSFYGVRGVPLRLFQSYLTNRKQFVQVNNSNSSFEYIRNGVPQGSVLGPLLFIIYINDLCYYMQSHCKTVLFADDTSFISRNVNFDLLCDRASDVVKISQIWFSTNNLKLNDDKTKSLTISSNSKLTSGRSCNLLGIVVDDSLTWNTHICELSRKLSSGLFLMRSLSTSVDTNTLVGVYFGLFHSLISYCTVLWGNASKALQVFRMQKRAIRLIAHIGPREHCQPYFRKFNIMPLPCIYVFQTLTHIHSNRYKYIKNADLHSYGTRYSDQILLPRCRLVKSEKNSLDIRLYNILPKYLKCLNDSQFKREIKKILLSVCFYSVEEFVDSFKKITKSVH